MTNVKNIKNILESPYSVDGYVKLIREVLPDASEFAPDRPWTENSNFSSHIVSYSHVANLATSDNKHVLILAVELQKRSYVENSRSKQRSYAKKLIENKNNDAAIIAYYTEGDPKWRLSFVRLDYEMRLEEGRLKTVENMTPARRYSFLVGQDEPSHTAIQRLQSLAEHSDVGISLDDIEEAFSVEKVTKEFFELYCEKYHQLREHLLVNEDFLAESEKCGFTVEQFAKKLLGQIVFLYFLQKKGWMGVGAWPTILTEKEYKDVYYTRGAMGKLIKEYLPIVYVQNGDGYVLQVNALEQIPNDVEETIANNLPKEKTKN